VTLGVCEREGMGVIDGDGMAAKTRETRGRPLSVRVENAISSWGDIKTNDEVGQNISV
jgi:hypothetical protein